MEQNIDKLREHLFATLEALRSAEKPMDLERARAISDVAQVVINSAKVEVEYLRLQGGEARSRFIGGEDEKAALPEGVQGIRRHRLVG